MLEDILRQVLTLYFFPFLRVVPKDSRTTVGDIGFDQIGKDTNGFPNRAQVQRFVEATMLHGSR